MNDEVGAKCYSLYLRDFTQSEIAKKLNITQSTVSRKINDIIKSQEYELGSMTVTTFIEVFKKTGQYWEESNKEYRELIEKVYESSNNEPNEKDKSLDNSKHVKTLQQVELISKLIEKRDKNMERILGLAQQGKVIHALRAIGNVLRKEAPSYDTKQYFQPCESSEIPQ